MDSGDESERGGTIQSPRAKRGTLQGSRASVRHCPHCKSGVPITGGAHTTSRGRFTIIGSSDIRQFELRSFVYLISLSRSKCGSQDHQRSSKSFVYLSKCHPVALFLLLHRTKHGFFGCLLIVLEGLGSESQWKWWARGSGFPHVHFINVYPLKKPNFYSVWLSLSRWLQFEHSSTKMGSLVWSTVRPCVVNIVSKYNIDTFHIKIPLQRVSVQHKRSCHAQCNYLWLRLGLNPLSGCSCCDMCKCHQEWKKRQAMVNSIFPWLSPVTRALAFAQVSRTKSGQFILFQQTHKIFSSVFETNDL